MYIQRLKKEYQQILREDNSSFTAAPIYEDYYHWSAIIEGPKDSPYEGGLFNLDIKLRKDYPISPPCVKFLTKIYHPCVSDNGMYELEIFHDKWAPALDLSKVLQATISFLSTIDSTLVCNDFIYREYLNDKAYFERVAKQWTQIYAMQSEINTPF